MDEGLTGFWRPPEVGIRAASESDVQRARILSAEIGAPVTADEGEYDLILLVSGEGISLHETGTGASGGIRADFGESSDAARRLGPAARGQPLARAAGLKKGSRTVVDATAGLGRDAAFLAGLGCTVIAVERSAVLGALLNDALERGPASARGRLTLVIGEAMEVLARMGSRSGPDVVYLDPMYPSSGKSALPKKELQILRRLVGDDSDSFLLFDAARECARERVVVKRPPRAAPLGGEPTMSYESKLTRYDVYLRQ